MSTKLLVNRARISEAKLADRAAVALTVGDVRVRVDQFALTANNISYALQGERIGYWRFFPDQEDGWGVVPIWGFGTITESLCDAVAVGATIWGFLPMASDLVMRPERVTPGGFTDGSAHRQELPYVYNLYARTNDDAPVLADMADLRSLVFPLFTTSYVLDDYIADNADFGAVQVILGSASSKTAFGLAHFLKARGGLKVIGLTSPGNIGFVEGLGYYDQVMAYDAVGSLDPAVPTVFVDMSGNGDVVSAVHHHFGDQLKASIGVGATHWSAPRAGQTLPGPRPAFFFAPGQIAKRDTEWGRGEMMRRATAANIAFCQILGNRVTIAHEQGSEAVAAAYRIMAAGQNPPDRGLILQF